MPIETCGELQLATEALILETDTSTCGLIQTLGVCCGCPTLKDHVNNNGFSSTQEAVQIDFCSDGRAPDPQVFDNGRVTALSNALFSMKPTCEIYQHMVDNANLMFNSSTAAYVEEFLSPLLQGQAAASCRCPPLDNHCEICKGGLQPQYFDNEYPRGLGLENWQSSSRVTCKAIDNAGLAMLKGGPCALLTSYMFVCGCNGKVLDYFGIDSVAKQKTLFWVPKVMALLSMMGSFSILWNVFRSGKHKKAHGQIMIGISAMDTIASLAWALSVFAPKRSTAWVPPVTWFDTQFQDVRKHVFLSLSCLVRGSRMELNGLEHATISLLLSCDCSELARTPFYSLVSYRCSCDGGCFPCFATGNHYNFQSRRLFLRLFAEGVSIRRVGVLWLCYSDVVDLRCHRFPSNCNCCFCATKLTEQEVGRQRKYTKSSKQVSGSAKTGLSSSIIYQRSLQRLRSSLKKDESTEPKKKKKKSDKRSSIETQVLFQSLFYIMAVSISYLPMLFSYIDLSGVFRSGPEEESLEWAEGYNLLGTVELTFPFYLALLILGPMQGMLNVMIYFLPHFAEYREKLKQAANSSRGKQRNFCRSILEAFRGSISSMFSSVRSSSGKSGHPSSEPMSGSSGLNQSKSEEGSSAVVTNDNNKNISFAESASKSSSHESVVDQSIQIAELVVPDDDDSSIGQLEETSSVAEVAVEAVSMELGRVSESDMPMVKGEGDVATNVNAEDVDELNENDSTRKSESIADVEQLRD